MTEKQKEKRQNRTVYIPRIGQRILKTAVAVLLCLLVYFLMGRTGKDMPAEALITAIICMQPFVRGTRRSGLSRMLGTLIGSVTGLGSLFLFYRIPYLTDHMLLAYIAMALGVLITLYAAVLLKHSEVSGLAAIIYVCIVIAFPEVEQPINNALWRVFGVFLGTVIAILVNLFRLPRTKVEGQIFFLDTQDLVPDRFTPISSTVLYHLNRLYEDGAQICLVSEHAPAFLTLQMSAARLHRPLIVMDGAAVWDTNRNEYAMALPISEEDLTNALEKLASMDLGCYIYTAHGNRTNVFHVGKMRNEEREVRELMRRSPYRNYLDDEAYDPTQVVCLKIIVEDEKMPEVEQQLYSVIHKGGMRSVVRKQGGVSGVSALYLYDRAATIGHTKELLMQAWQEETPGLEAVPLKLPKGYRTDHDAIRLLQMVEQRYMPLTILAGKKKDKQEEDLNVQ